MSREPKEEDNDDIASFLARESSTSANKKRIESLVDAARRSEDPLLGALSLVLAANHDYAKSVSSLLTTDLSQGQSLTEIKERLTTLIQKTDTLVTSQEELLAVLNTIPETHKTIFETVIHAQALKQESFLNDKFSKIFEAVGLKKDGDSFGEADSLIRKVKYLVSKQVMTVIIGMCLYNLALWIIEHAGKFAK